MRTLVLVTLGSIALATGAYAQSSLSRADRAQALRAQAAVIQDGMGPTEISRLCGVDYAITDPDPHIRLELRRQCIAGLDGGND
jgi:hypothetical protein